MAPGKQKYLGYDSAMTYTVAAGYAQLCAESTLRPQQLLEWHGRAYA
jgi:hypothetical protein